MTGPFVAAQHDLVSNHIQFFLCFSLDIFCIQRSHHTNQRASVHLIGNGFDSSHNIIQQRSKITTRARNSALIFNDELSKGGTGMHQASSQEIKKC